MSSDEFSKRKQGSDLLASEELYLTLAQREKLPENLKRAIIAKKKASGVAPKGEEKPKTERMPGKPLIVPRKLLEEEKLKKKEVEKERDSKNPNWKYDLKSAKLSHPEHKFKH